MASGHVSRIKRPNTWLHRPMLQNVKKVLANPEPSTHGTFRTCLISELSLLSGVKRKLDLETPKGGFWREADMRPAPSSSSRALGRG